MTTTNERTIRPRSAGSAAHGLTVAVLVLAAACWVWLALYHGNTHHGAATGHDDMTDQMMPGHTGSGTGHASSLSATLAGPAAWYVGWLVMVVAMMLPPALPLLRVVRRLGTRHPRPALLVAICGSAFIAAWAVAGGAMMLAAALLTGVIEQWAWLQANPQVPSGLAAVLVGGYQLTPWKRACLTACRSPLGLAMTTWTGTRPRPVESGLLGLSYGAACVGCCWALMLLTFTVGTAALGLMVVVGVLMAAERLLPRTRPLVPAIALAAVAVGLLLLAGVLPPGLVTV